MTNQIILEKLLIALALASPVLYLIIKQIIKTLKDK